MAIKEDSQEMIDPPEGFDARISTFIKLFSLGTLTKPAQS